MTALDHPTHSVAAGTRAVAVVTRVATGLRAFLRRMKNRRQINRLCDLTDHELADIGLRRTDLLVAMRSPMSTDPTAHLSMIVRERLSTEEGARRVC
ncbi:DUF1127 domain-containing protein [Aquamicrobium sp. LC103]|uniref:DUF1127 domain-containing protein n=1 Tax=Aquamicrobium sp. LC103 TaxID=1120658 RepID=UPI00063EB479|nr:DUF1127 domain-containing protein [Aquamicrobium sp. LC103]TKT74126.1 DUF1127 domain-containing protein [Aquamicrobium sp. LC103]